MIRSLFDNILLCEKLGQVLDSDFQYKVHHLYDEIYILTSTKWLHFEKRVMRGYIISVDKEKQDVKVLFDGYLPGYIHIYPNNDKEYVLMGWTLNLEPTIIKLKNEVCLFEPYENNKFMKELIRFSLHLGIRFSKNRFVLTNGKTKTGYYVMFVYNQGKCKEYQMLYVPEMNLTNFLQRSYINFLTYDDCIKTVIGNVDLKQDTKIVWFHLWGSLDGKLYLVLATEDGKSYYIDTLLSWKELPNVSFEPKNKILIYTTPSNQFIKHNIITNEKEQICGLILPSVYSVYTVSNFLLFQEKKVDNVVFYLSKQKNRVTILTQTNMYEECYCVGYDDNYNYYYFVVDRKNLFLKLLKRKQHPEIGEFRELQNFDLKDEKSFNFKVYENSKYCYKRNRLDQQIKDLFVLQINDKFYIFDENFEKFIKLDIDTFQDIEAIKVFQIENFYWIEIEKTDKKRYDLYYQTNRYFTFYSNKNVSCKLNLIQLPFGDKDLLYIGSSNGKIKNWYVFDYAKSQINAKCFNEEANEQDFKKEFLKQVEECIIPIYEYPLVTIATISPDQLSRLYRFYRSFYQTKAMSVFAKGLFQTAKNKEKTSNLKI